MCSDLKPVGAIRRTVSKAYHRRFSRSGASSTSRGWGIATAGSPLHVSRRIGMFDDRRMIPGCTSGVLVEVYSRACVTAWAVGRIDAAATSGVPTRPGRGRASRLCGFSLTVAGLFAGSDDHCASPLQHKWMGRNPSEFIGIRGRTGGKVLGTRARSLPGEIAELTPRCGQSAGVVRSATRKGRSVETPKSEADSSSAARG